MKIIAARVIVTCPGRNFVTLKIETDAGLYGLGDGTLNGRELSVVAYLNEHIIPCLIGRDAHQIEDIWQFLYRGAYWRRGPVTMCAIAAVDTALWDLKAKAAGLPLYQLLGGRSRDGGAGVRARQRPRHRGDLRRGRALPGDGLPRDPRAERRARPGLHLRGLGRQDVLRAGRRGAADGEPVVDSRSTWRTPRSCSRRCACASAPSSHLLHDVHHRLTPIEAARLGKALEPYALFWLEDATPAENQEAFRLIRQHTVTPLAVGEVFNTIWDCKQLIEEQLIDYIRTTVVHAGGITHLRRIADFAVPEPGAHRLPRRHRPLAGVHGRCAALGHCDPELRHPGIHAPHGRDRRGLPARLHLQERGAASGGGQRARAWTSTRSSPRSTPTSAPTCR